MAITGKFAADFSDFYSAVQTAEAHLRSFETDASRVQTRLNAVSDAFSGRKILSEATIAVKAVSEIGGATALTATEQAKVNALVNEAIAKYAALGKEAPADMVALAKATESTHEESKGLTTGMVALGTSIGTMAASAVTALGRLAVEGIGAAVTAIKDLAVEGAEVSDISGNFDHLATAAGHVSQTLLGEMRAGTHGTINDLQLMKTVNADLAAGMNLTDQQFGALAKGAFSLAQATGTDVTAAMDAMNDAMLTGQTRSIALLTGKIDLESAEMKYAHAMGRTADSLSTTEKLEAARVAILDSVASATARLGDQEDGLEEKVQQARASWDNFRQSLAQSVAESPVLTAGFDAIRTALTEAFGGNQEELIKKIVAGINQAAIMATDFGLVAIEMARGVVVAYGTIMVPVDAVIVGITAMVEAVIKANTKILELAASIPGIGSAYTDAAQASAGAGKMFEDMRAQAVEDLKTTQGLVSGKGALHDTLNKLEGGITSVKAAMVEANTVQHAQGEAVKASTAATQAGAAAQLQHAGATDTDTAALKAREEAMKRAAVEEKKMAEAMAELNSVGTSFRDTLAAMDQGVVDMAEMYIRAGASTSALKVALGLTDGQVKAITESIKAQEKAIDEANADWDRWKKKQDDVLKEVDALWVEHDKVLEVQTKTATDRQIADIERWKQALIQKHKEAGTYTQQVQDAITANAAAKLTAMSADWGALENASKEHLDAVAAKANATYAEALSGTRTFSTEAIEHFRQLAEAAQTAADTYGTSFENGAKRAADAVNKAADEAIGATKKIQGVLGGESFTGSSFSNPAQLSWGMTQAAAQAKATELGGVINYDDFGNPYVYIPGINQPGSTTPMWHDSTGARTSTPPQGFRGWAGSSLGGAGFGGFRAAGGPVNSQRAYVVGERGPELFIPDTAGRVAPSTGGISVVVQVQGAVIGTADQLAQLMGEAIVGRLRRQGVRLPTGV